eukprot:COSAG02_NODE_1548_length_11970_cov_43.634235_3_plen_71_part_00
MRAYGHLISLCPAVVLGVGAARVQATGRSIRRNAATHRTLEMPLALMPRRRACLYRANNFVCSHDVAKQQ